MRKITGNKGAALLLSLMLLIVLAAIAAGYGSLVSHAVRLASAQRHDAEAFYSAEAGLNKAVWYLTHTAPDGSVNGSWRTAGYPQDPGPDAGDARQEDLDEGSYIMWVEDDGGRVRITARGLAQGAVRTIRQEFSSVQPVSVVAESWREIGS